MIMMWFGIGILLIAIAVVVGIVLMNSSSRMRRHGGDRQPYERPPHGSHPTR